MKNNRCVKKSNPTKANPTKTIRARTSPAIGSIEELRRRVMADIATQRVPLSEQSFDEQLTRFEQEGLAPLGFLARLISAEADCRRERAIERRIKGVRFPDICTLADFDWQFNAETIDRAQIEQLASCDFLRRKD